MKLENLMNMWNYFDSKFTGTFRQKTKNKSMDWPFNFLKNWNLIMNLIVMHQSYPCACDRLLVENPDNAALFCAKSFCKILNLITNKPMGFWFREDRYYKRNCGWIFGLFKSYYDIAANYDQNVRNYLDLEIQMNTWMVEIF
jgi:hypothetical protein